MKKRTKPNRRGRPTGPKTLEGSREAKRTAAVLLEVLSGVRGPQEGAEALGTSLSRYYLLETRGLQGLITALEPRPKGRQMRPEDERDRLQRDKQRLERELSRSQALVRAAQRSLGLSSPAKAAGRGKLGSTKPVRRRRRRVVRGSKAVAALRQAIAADGVERTGSRAGATTTGSSGRSEHGRRTTAAGDGAGGPAAGHAGGQA
jgi:hypothetical protein